MSSGIHRRSGRSSSSPGSLNPDAAIRHLALRVGAVLALAVLALLALAEFTELRGELAFARFYRMSELAERPLYTGDFARVVQNGSGEAELVMLFCRRNPDALSEVVVSCLFWSDSEELDPLLRLRLAEKAVGAAALAVRAAPSDYEHWLWLAHTQAALGLWDQAGLCLNRAQELAPPGEELEL